MFVDSHHGTYVTSTSLLPSLPFRRRLFRSSSESSRSASPPPRQEPAPTEPSCGLKSAVISKLPTERRKATASEDDVCHVCMEQYKAGKRVAQLPCSHRFCRSCIKPWLSKHHTCPVCRYEFPVEDRKR